MYHSLKDCPAALPYLVLDRVFGGAVQLQTLKEHSAWGAQEEQISLDTCGFPST